MTDTCLDCAEGDLGRFIIHIMVFRGLMMELAEILIVIYDRVGCGGCCVVVEESHGRGWYSADGV